MSHASDVIGDKNARYRACSLRFLTHPYFLDIVVIAILSSFALFRIPK